MSDSDQSIRCMLLPYSAELLLVPSSAVSEIIGYTQPTKADSNRDWFLGLTSWRGLTVPVVSLESMCQVKADVERETSRMVIISNPNDDSELPYAGFHIYGTPRTYMAVEDELPQGESENLCKYMIAKIQMNEETWLVPNLEVILSDLKAELMPA